MTTLKRKPVLALIAAALLAASLAAPADAQRGGGGRGGGGGDHGNRGGSDHGNRGGGDQGNRGGGSGGGDRNRGGGDQGNRGGGGDRNGGGGGNWNNGNHNNNDWNRNNNNRNDWDRGRDHDRDHRDNWSLGFSFGSPFYRNYDYDYGRPYYQYSPGITVYSNAWGLRPFECRVDYEFDYWFGRPADVEVRRCADAYGNIYIVEGGRRLWRYR